MALRMGMGTSRAFPIPKPAWPCWSPTTTKAEKLRFLPPLTTLVTRLIATTWSFKLFELTSIGCRIASASLRICFDMSLKFQPRFPGRLRERFDAAVVLISTPIKHYFLDSGGLGAFSDHATDDLCRGDVAAALGLLARVCVQLARGDDGLAGEVVNHLRVDVAHRTENGKPRTLLCAGHLLAHAAVNAHAVRIPRYPGNWSSCHGLLLLPC